MADIHFDGAGSNTAPYDTTAKASTTWAGASVGAGTAGDRLLFSSGFSDSAAGITINLTGATNANNIQMLSGTLGATSGIDALVGGATLISTNTTYTIAGGGLYIEGFTFRASSASSHDMTVANTNGGILTMRGCTTEHTGAGSSSTFAFGNTTQGGGGVLRLYDHTLKFGHASQIVNCSSNVEIHGGSIASGGTSPTAVFKASSSTRGARLLVESFSFANCSAGVNLCGSGQGGFTAIFRDIRVPASWSGAPITSGNIQPGQRVEVWNYTDGTTRKRVWIVDYGYSLVEENTIVMSGGSSDEAGYSLKMTSTANVCRTSPARSPAILVENNGTGSKTITVEIIHDSATALTESEVWLEVEAPASATGVGILANDGPSSVIAAGTTAQASSSVTWTTTGLTNPNKQKLEVTLTPPGKGNLHCRVCLAKQSKVIYINAKASIA